MAMVKIYLASTELEAAMLGPMETFTATIFGAPIGALQRPKLNQQAPITFNSAIQQINWKMGLIGLLPDAACAVLRTKRGMHSKRRELSSSLFCALFFESRCTWL